MAANAGGHEVVDGASREAQDRRALTEAIDACARDYPSASRSQIEDLVLSAYERTSTAKVHQYRVLLAERSARLELKAQERAVPGRGKRATNRP
jgi:hypothetical protein